MPSFTANITVDTSAFVKALDAMRVRMQEPIDAWGKFETSLLGLPVITSLYLPSGEMIRMIGPDGHTTLVVGTGPVAAISSTGRPRRAMSFHGVPATAR